MTFWIYSISYDFSQREEKYKCINLKIYWKIAILKNSEFTEKSPLLSWMFYLVDFTKNRLQNGDLFLEV